MNRRIVRCKWFARSQAGWIKFSHGPLSSLWLKSGVVANDYGWALGWPPYGKLPSIADLSWDGCRTHWLSLRDRDRGACLNY